MTYHIAYDHQCQSCGADFIPYEEHLPCPKCGTAAATWLHYPRQAAESLNVNLASKGSYMPGAFWVGSLGDRVLYLLFQIFERWRHKEPQADFSAHLQEELPKIGFEPSHEYLREHLGTIALRAFDELEKLPKPAAARPSFEEIDAERGEMEAFVNAAGWAKCPYCGKSFATYSSDYWSGKRHISCGTSLVLKQRPA